MNLADVISIKFPGVSFLKDVAVMDNGHGQYIGYWNIPNVPMPDAATISAWMADPVVIAANLAAQKSTTNAYIYAALDAIDLKSIRACREQDTARMATYEQQATALRAQLV